LPKAHELAAGETGVHLVTRAGAPPSLRRSKSAQPEHGSVARSTKGQRNLLRRRKMVTPGWGPRPNMPGRCAQTSCQTTNSLMDCLLWYPFYLFEPQNFLPNINGQSPHRPHFDSLQFALAAMPTAAGLICTRTPAALANLNSSRPSSISPAVSAGRIGGLESRGQSASQPYPRCNMIVTRDERVWANNHL
jgi:hypothetical protein